MAEGLTVIAAGLLVVLCIMLSMFLFIEVILKFDQLLRARADRASSRQEVQDAEAATDSEPSRNRDEVIAAIGLALQRHLARGAVSRDAATGPGSGPAPWASSGRVAIMTERQRVTSRRS